ncbi:MAG: SUMF1/EgtB/PvdO family nonheme iron enzyme, partial [Bacteroidales bacterium]|nr:SUMF1/EgtB/PvdO family nonheme iron enzyme [Bacteroidales bacterium]
MKKLVFLGLIAALILSGCNSSSTGNGELVGVQKREKWFEPDPYGMVKVPMGSFVVGPNDEDPTFAMNSQSKTVSIDAFWMDETEITNNEYRQFVHWVIDSLTRKTLGEQSPEEYLISEDANNNPIDPPYINWETKIDTRDPEVATALEGMYIPENERFFRRKELDTRKLVYSYQDINYQEAAKEKRNFNRSIQNSDKSVTFYQDNELASDRSKFVKSYTINIYPDTLCWISDFTYSYNDPMAKMYFWHPGFDDYPVVGVTQEQAQAFCIWRTQLYNNYLLTSKAGASVQNYRLPTEYEWEYAARGGRNLSLYPWGSPYTRNEKGCFLANFKPLRGNYVDDGFLKPSPVGSFEPNDYNLYDMAGNVAEWTISAFDEAAYSFTHDMNPNYEYSALPNESPVMKRKVVRGGSWKDISYY